MTRTITHVIYDVDGLLLDTEHYYTEAYQAIAARYGKTFDWSVKSRTIGRKAEDSARIIIDTLGLPITLEQWLESRKTLLDDLFRKCEPLPGAVRLTRHLHAYHIPQGIATSSNRHFFDVKTSRHREWFSIFDCLVSGDDPAVTTGKPAPDIFLVAARRMGAVPEHCLVFEDSPSGIAAALAAGMSGIAIPDPNLDDAAFSGAHRILRSLEEFDPEEWGLPDYEEHR